MPLIGKAIAIVARRMGGQLMLELPDDLPPSFIAELLRGANSHVRRDPSFAMFVHEDREDISDVIPRVDFRELAMYRQGQHLAVTYASKNRGMTTYSSVYPLLLSDGFPSAQAGELGAGVASISDFTEALAEVLLEACPTLAIERPQFRIVASDIIGFLARAYEISGGGQSSAAKDWWIHVRQWVANVVAYAGGRGHETIALLYGAAGLPNPGTKSHLDIKPKDYIKALEDRWADVDAIRLELKRIGMGTGEGTGADVLAELDWPEATEHARYQSDSPVARVSLATQVDQRLKTEGWAAIGAEAFEAPVANGRAQLTMRRDGKALPTPYPQSPPVLLARGTDIYDPVSRQSTYRGIEFVVPVAESKSLSASMADGGILPRIEVSGVGLCLAKFQVRSAKQGAGSLQITGDLTVRPGRSKPNHVVLEIAGPGFQPLEPFTFFQVRPNERLLWLKEEGAGRKRAKVLGPWGSSVDAGQPTVVPVNKPSRYELAIAWGSELDVSADGWRLGDGALGCAFWSGTEGLFAIAAADLTSTIALTYCSDDVFSIDIASTSVRPLSPIVAAATGARSATDKLLKQTVLGRLEAEMLDILRELDVGHALGAIQATGSKAGEKFDASRLGTRSAKSIAARTDLFPKLPSEALLDLPAYVALRDAYRELGLPELIAAIEQREKSADLTVSRISLDSIQKDCIDSVVTAYNALLASMHGLSASDRFWAKNPFSLAVFSGRSGIQKASAILLSPLHPIRLAWSWSVQVGLREAYDDSASPSASLALLDGTNFPAFVTSPTNFKREEAYLPVPVDARPEDIYVGWHVGVPVVNGSPTIPDWLLGERFPAEGLSTLTPSSISAAVDDFLRVSPEVQTLQVAITSTTPIRRSAVMDDGVLLKLKSLAASSSSLEGVSSVTIKDSEHRLGEIPQLGRFEESILSARPGFNLTWRSAPDADTDESHITFVEGGAVQASFEKGGLGLGWLPNLPLRRIPIRKSEDAFTTLDYSLSEDELMIGGLPAALHNYERAESGESYVINVMANFSGADARPNWLVAGDFGVDPNSLAGAVAGHIDGSYVLWDWRPATTVAAGRGDGMRVQPYFVLASVPPALSSAIRNRLQRLNSTISNQEIERRAQALVSTLAKRAIGLNTLLSIGHHQATGAIGFFFALSSLQRWVDQAPADELRLVIPVDAVDPFLRDSIGYPRTDSRRRADLIAISATYAGNGRSYVNLVPIEIKHYGLVPSERKTTFPMAGEERLREHAEQLRDYGSQLRELCERAEGIVGSKASMLGQRLVAVIDAGMQLNSFNSEHGIHILRSVAAGTARFSTGTGILLWYQAFAENEHGETAVWDEFGGEYGDEADRRIEIRVNPAAYDAAYWENDADGGCHSVVLQALRASVEDVQCCAPAATSSMDGEFDKLETPRLLATDGVAKSAARAEKALGSPCEREPLDGQAATVIFARSSNAPAAPKISEQELERRYDQLISTLSEFHVKVNRPKVGVPYKEGPAFIEYAVIPAYGVSVNKIDAQLQNLKLRMRLAADMQLGCSTHMGSVVITVPKDDKDRYFVDAEIMWSRWDPPSRGFVVPVGEDASGDIVELDLSSSNSPHLLIAGVTGSGKSEALLTILHGAAHFYSPDELKLKLIDPKGTELNTLAELPHTEGPIGTTAEDAIALLDGAVDEMERRYAVFKAMPGHVRNIAEFQAAGGRMPRWILVLDEYADLTNDDGERKQIETSLKRVSQKARAAGIHLIVSTQKPVVAVVNTVVKGNLPAKVALRVNTLTESRVVLDEGGAEQLAGKGDALIKTGNGKVRVQFARYDVKS